MNNRWLKTLFQSAALILLETVAAYFYGIRGMELIAIALIACVLMPLFVYALDEIASRK
jgi:hypothetical protein